MRLRDFGAAQSVYCAPRESCRAGRLRAGIIARVKIILNGYRHSRGANRFSPSAPLRCFGRRLRMSRNRRASVPQFGCQALEERHVPLREVPPVGFFDLPVQLGVMPEQRASLGRINRGHDRLCGPEGSNGGHRVQYRRLRRPLANSAMKRIGRNAGFLTGGRLANLRAGGCLPGFDPMCDNADQDAVDAVFAHQTRTVAILELLPSVRVAQSPGGASEAAIAGADASADGISCTGQVEPGQFNCGAN